MDILQMTHSTEKPAIDPDAVIIVALAPQEVLQLLTTGFLGSEPQPGMPKFSIQVTNDVNSLVTALKAAVEAVQGNDLTVITIGDPTDN